MRDLNILFLSNGSGEDTVSASLINEFKQKRPDYYCKAMPLVGIGKAFREKAIDLTGPLKEMPSGGLVNNNLKALLRDIKSGLAGLTLEQIKTIKQSDRLFDMIVCVGDRYPLILAGLFTSLPLFFVGVAQSVRVHGYSLFERYLMQRRVKMVYTRDEDTAVNLRKYNINAEFLGNPLMDTFSLTEPDMNIPENSGIITILPGSRNEIYYNLRISLQVCRKLYSHSESLLFLMALSPLVSQEDLFKDILKEGWSTYPGKGRDFITLKHTDGTEINLSSSYFGWMIKSARVVLGLAGTGNEQAAGLGKPVVTFWSPERQVRPAFMKHQKGLLGESLLVMSPDPDLIACRIKELIDNPSVSEKMGKSGSNLMGERGGLCRIVDSILKFSQNGWEQGQTEN